MAPHRTRGFAEVAADVARRATCQPIRPARPIWVTTASTANWPIRPPRRRAPGRLSCASSSLRLDAATTDGHRRAGRRRGAAHGAAGRAVRPRTSCARPSGTRCCTTRATPCTPCVSRDFAPLPDRLTRWCRGWRPCPDFLTAARSRLGDMSPIHVETAVAQLGGTLALLDDAIPAAAADASDRAARAGRDQPPQAARGAVADVSRLAGHARRAERREPGTRPGSASGRSPRNSR